MILSCNNITKTFGTDTILSDCSFHIEEREKAAIVGPNGAGKSTLLKIFMGRLPADDGTVAISKDKTLGYLAQHQNLSSDGTIYDELLSVKKDIIALEEKIRETEQQMKNATGEQLDTLLDQYTKMNHQFELENGYAYQSEIVGVLKGLGFTDDDFSLPVNTLSGGQKKKVLIAGGGPGGLYAAWTAARRGHSVVLCEKEVALGGILKSEIALPFKREMFALTETYERFARNAGVEIRFNTEVTPEYVEKEAPDALIIAAGSRPLVPPIKGMDGEQVVVVNELYRNLDKISDKVVVMGGGLAGCECAISLGMEGKEVQLVEMRDALAPDANVRHRPLLLKEIEKQVKAVHTGYRAEEITPEGVWCTDANGERHLVEGTTVICALGQRARTDVVEQLRNTAPFVRVIGDARRVSTITNAVYQGYHAALDI